MKKKKTLNVFMLLCMLLLLSWQAAQSQEIALHGQVTAADHPHGLPGVSVTVEGSNIGTTSNEEGRYRLTGVPRSGRLVFSSVGFKTQTVDIGARPVIDVVLETAEPSQLDQVVVIGYGTTKKKDLTGAIASVNAERLTNEHPTSVQDILRANVPGLNVGFKATAKGDASLQIRGKKTLNASSSPLIVLDGVIYYGSLADINPNDIETVDVLKDASSAAVYGAKAASGVIQITTKKGRTSKPIINVNSSIGVSTMSVNERIYDANEFLNVWRRNVKYSTNVKAKPYQYDDPRTLPSDISIADWLAYDNSSPSADPVTVWLQRLNLQPVEIANYKKGQSINWYDLMFHNGLRQDYNVSLSGKKEGLNYYWSLGYMNNEGVIVGDKFNTARSRLNLDAKVTDFLSAGINTQFSIRDENGIPVDWTLMTGNSPWGSYYTDDSTQIRPNPNDDAGAGRNPFGILKYTNRLQRYYELNASMYAKVSLPFGIKFQTNFTPRFEWYNYFNGESSLWRDWAGIGGRATRENRNIYQWQVDNLLSWNRDIGVNHHVDVTLLQNAEKFQVWRNKVVATGFLPSDVLSYHNMGAATGIVACNNCVYSDEGDQPQKGDEVSTADALMARLFYSYKQRYMLTLTVRRDGYSAFGQMNPRATYPSAAFGWAFSDESFMKNINWLNYGKLRVSYGSNGNRDIGRYVALADLLSDKYLHVLSDGTVVQVSQLYVNNMQNKLLKWETTTAFNLGLDFAVANNRVDGSIDVYKSKTTDLLVQHSLPDVTGFGSIWDNLGQVDNKGFEISLNSKNIRHQNFSWNTSANFSLNRNKIVHLYGAMQDILDAEGKVIGRKEKDDRGNNWFIGHALDVIWDQKEIGVWQVKDQAEAEKYGVKPGDFHVEDVNKDYKYTDDDRQFLGYTEPRFRWTLRNEFTFFKNLSFSFLLYSYWGQMDRYNQAKNNSTSYPDRVSSYAFPFWTSENPINDYARLFSSDGGASYNVYRKKSFIRLDNIALAYNMPENITKRIQAQDIKFYFTIKNAGVYAPHWTYWDPENTGPTPRLYTLGINLTL
ncbi:MAG: SusC/RagA family TonB-linked outer membrane protein [Niabella sp.]